MWQFLRSVVKSLFVGAALIVIALAIGVGAFRLVVTQLPGYRGEIQAWAREELGLTMQFSGVDARWSLLGPELTFYDASVSNPGEESDPLFSAREASIGISALALITEQRLAVTRLTVVDTELAIERDVDGALRLQGAASRVESPTPELAIKDLPPVEVIARDSAVIFNDRVQGVSWEFQDVRLRLAREADRLQLEAQADAPAELASRIDISAEGSLTTLEGARGSAWRIVAEFRDLDLSALQTLFPEQPRLPRSGVGDLSIWLDAIGNRVEQATVEVALEDLVLASQAGFSDGESTYELLELTTEWSRVPDGWSLALSNLNLRRQDRSWPGDVSVDVEVAKNATGLAGFGLSSTFLRLEDLTPLIAGLPTSELTDTWLMLSPVGDLLDLEFDWAPGSASPVYTASTDFRDLGVSGYEQWPGVTGLSGELRADSRTGRLALTTRDVSVRWPRIFRQQLDFEELMGILIWRQGQDGVRLVSDNLTLNNRDARTRTNLELTIPPDGSSPRLELRSEVFGFDTTRTSHYLPAGVLPAPVVAWLDRSIVRGFVPRGAVTFAGPVEDFPFYENEGRFQAEFDVENGVLAFMEDWPEARDVRGTVEFMNEGFTARGMARVLGEDMALVSGGIADMSNAVVMLEGSTTTTVPDVLSYLKEVPLFARRMGPDLTRLEASAGTAQVDLDLNLPLRNLPAVEIEAQLDVTDGELTVAGFGLAATDIRGTLNLDREGVSGTGIEATLLNGPVVADVSGSDEPGYRARLDFEGEVAAESVVDALDLPLRNYLAGQTRWEGSLLLPSNPVPGAPSPRAPLRVSLNSNLSGVALKFPAPLEKAPAEATGLHVELAFAQSERVEIEGNLGAANRFALSMLNRADGLSLRRGSLRFGGAYPLLPAGDGLDVRGTLGQVRLDDWLDLLESVASETTLDALVSSVDLNFTDFSAFGQRLGATELSVEREPPQWLVEVASEPVSGNFVMPLDLGSREQIIAEMQRLHLTTGEAGNQNDIDPRELPGLRVYAEDFVVGQRRYGRLSADVRAEAAGLNLVSFETLGEGFTLEGMGAWERAGPAAETSLALTLRSENVAIALEELALDPVLEGEFAEVTADVRWPGGPSADWRQGIGGEVTLRLDQGSVLDLEPGAGRMMGLMSITALPRRLALDFRDVFNRGLVFDEVRGNFVLIDGNAYTDNLLLTGPVADIGVVGRTGLKDQTYQQQAVVTAEPGKVLPTMGFLAGPGVGTALLIFTRIFREPLKGIGRASYCMSGTWDDPTVERLNPTEPNAGELCADLPPGGLNIAQD